MNNFSHITPYAYRAAGATALSVLVLAVLFAFEGMPGRFAAPEAHAWHCEAMDATLIDSQSNLYELSWQFSNDQGISVTIDQLPGQSWDGTSGSTQVNVYETTTYVARAHKVGTDTTLTCEVTVEPPVSEPEVPVCPFSPSEGVTVVNFNGGKERSDATVLLSRDGRTELTASELLPAGTYSIRTVSWDGYATRVNVSQPHEQWNVEVRSGSAILGTAGPTTDIEDNVIEDTETDTFADAFTITETGNTVAAVHAYPTHDSPNSVVPVCIELTLESEPEPVCDMFAAPTTIAPGESATVTWTSSNVDSVSFDSGMVSSELNGDETVSPLVTTTYTGTFTYGDDETLTCSAMVTVEDEPPVYDPSCELFASPTTIAQGGSSTITWDSTDVSSVDITNIGTALATSGSQSVSPTVTTTYTGTFYGLDGESYVCPATVTVTVNEPELECSLTANPTKLGANGGTVTLSWTSDGATNVSFSPNIGSGLGVNDSTTTFVSSATTFTGTFSDENENSVTCSARVSKEGGGGSCLNCGDDDDDDDDREEEEEEEEDDEVNPTILLARTITLDQVPYTGFKAGPLMTTLFWLTIFALSAGIAYIITHVRPWERLRMQYATPLAPTPSYSPATLAKTTDEPAALPVAAAATPNLGSDSDEHISHVEEMAHRENVLLSPEAVRIVQAAMKQSGSSADAYLTNLIEVAKARFPREDGWILLSKERVVELTQDSASTTTKKAADTPNASQTPKAQMSDRVEPNLPGASSADPFRLETRKLGSAGAVAPTQPTDTKQVQKTQAGATTANTSLIPSFVRMLSNLEKKQVFDVLRKLAAQGVRTDAFIGRVVRELDEVYKHRLEGNHNPNKELAAVTGAWTNNDFEEVLGILVESVDYSYASERIGAKVALAKVFEYFERKQA